MGVWEGADGCAEEWALQNYALDLSAWSPDTQLILEAPQFMAGEQVEEFWYRLMLTSTQIDSPVGTFAAGETEDYLYSTIETPLAATQAGVLAAPVLAPRPTEPRFACPGGIIGHGVWEFTFFITQTADTRSFRVTEIERVDVLRVKTPTPAIESPRRKRS